MLKVKKQALNRKSIVIGFCCGVMVTLTILIIGVVGYVFSQQYNSKGISSFLCITIDDNREREYIGELDGHAIYVEGLKTDDLYYTTVLAHNIPLKEAVGQGLVSIKDRQKKARDIINDGDTEILRYENYEIVITGTDCIIRPITK